MRKHSGFRPLIDEVRLPDRITPATVSQAGHVVSVVADASDAFATFVVVNTTLPDGSAGFELQAFETGHEAPITYDFHAKGINKFDFDATGVGATVTWKNEADVKSHAVAGMGDVFFYGGPVKDTFVGGSGVNTFVGGTGFTTMRGSRTSPNFFHEIDGGSGLIVANQTDVIFTVDDPGDPGYTIKYRD